MIKATIRVTPVENGLQPEFGYDEGHVYTTTVNDYELPIQASDYDDGLNMALMLGRKHFSGFGVGATYNISVEFENG
jgi:hypothetical protein